MDNLPTTIGAMENSQQSEDPIEQALAEIRAIVARADESRAERFEFINAVRESNGMPPIDVQPDHEGLRP